MLSPDLCRLHLLPKEVRWLVGECVGQSAACNDEIGIVSYLLRGRAVSVLETVGEYLKRTGLMKMMMEDRKFMTSEMCMTLVTEYYRRGVASRDGSHISWADATSTRWKIGDACLTNFVGEISERMKVWELHQGKLFPLEDSDGFKMPAFKRKRRRTS